MKRLISSLIGTLSLLTLAIIPMASAQTWMATISQLPAHTTSHSFNVQYTVLSTETQSFTVQLQQSSNEGPFTDCGAPQVTSDDPHGQNGNSGAVPACVTADGSYSFKFEVTPAEEQAQTTETTSTIVDTAAPGHPDYLGKTASGSSTVIKFTAPSDSDVASVNIYAGSSKTYDGDNAHKVGSVAVSPGQTYSQTVNASSSLFFSVQAFDAAGNGSNIVGDPGTVVNPVRFVNVGGQGGGGGAGAGTATGTTTGQVQGATTTTPNTTTGQVNAPGSSNNSKNNGKVLGAETTVNHNNKTAWISSIAGALALILLGLYYWVWPRWHKQP